MVGGHFLRIVFVDMIPNIANLLEKTSILRFNAYFFKKTHFIFLKNCKYNNVLIEENYRPNLLNFILEIIIKE